MRQILLARHQKQIEHARLGRCRQNSVDGRNGFLKAIGKRVAGQIVREEKGRKSIARPEGRMVDGRRSRKIAARRPDGQGADPVGERHRGCHDDACWPAGAQFLCGR